MRTLIENAKLIYPSHPLHNQILNLVIENGIITYIGKETVQCEHKLSEENLHFSPGWVDMRCSLPDPGFEYKEDLSTGAKAAIKGGFTDLCILPTTQPGIDSKDVVEYVKSRSNPLKVSIWPLAYASVAGKGQEMAELIDLAKAGAVAFTDAHHWVAHSGLLSQLLQYLQMNDGLLINRPNDPNVSPYGLMNESKESVNLGLKGIPKMAEEIAIQRDIEVLRYTGGKIHFTLVTTSKSVDLIRKAKKEGLKVTCDTAPQYLHFRDTQLADFDTNLKLMPPIREEEDIEALLDGLKDGTIDCLVSDHQPQDEESKHLEFDMAEFGITNLETAFALSNSYLPIDLLIEKWALNPRKILKLPLPEIKVGAEAKLTLFNPDLEWTYSKESIASKSKNSPFIGNQLKGKAIATIHKGTVNII